MSQTRWDFTVHITSGDERIPFALIPQMPSHTVMDAIGVLEATQMTSGIGYWDSSGKDAYSCYVKGVKIMTLRKVSERTSTMSQNTTEMNIVELKASDQTVKLAESK